MNSEQKIMDIITDNTKLLVRRDLHQIWCKFAIFLLTDSSQCNSIHPRCKIIADLCEKKLKGIEINWIDYYFEHHNYCYKNSVRAYDLHATVKVMSISYAICTCEAIAYYFDIYNKPDFHENKEYYGYPDCILGISSSCYSYNCANDINPDVIACIYNNLYRKINYENNLFSQNKQKEKILELLMEYGINYEQ